MPKMPDSSLRDLLDRKWQSIALFAYNEFLEHGRGVVVLEPIKTGELQEAQMQYVVYPGPHDDAQISALLTSHDPGSEVLIHYLDEQGSVHTMRFHAATDSVSPETLWIRHCLLRRPPLTPGEIQSGAFTDEES